jgi:hypothetical protein
MNFKKKMYVRVYEGNEIMERSSYLRFFSPCFILSNNDDVEKLIWLKIALEENSVFEDTCFLPKIHDLKDCSVDLSVIDDDETKLWILEEFKECLSFEKCEDLRINKWI